MRRVARLYYEHGLTHQEIADALGLSRVRVTRLLAEARATGVVEIIVHADDALFDDEERRLVQALGLRQAWVAPTPAELSRRDASLAAVGVEAMEHHVHDGDVVAVGVSTTVAVVAERAEKTGLECSFVPIGGSTAGLSKGANPHEIALRFAAGTGGKAFHIPAPLVATSPQAAQAIRDDPGVREGLELARGADVLIAGIGDAGPGILYDSLDEDTRAELRRLGAVGDLGGRFFDAHGASLASSLDERVVAITLDDIRALPTRIGVARGLGKVQAVSVAATSGIIDVLVTDIETAQALLASAEG